MDSREDKKEKNNSKVLFKGAKLSKREANKAGIGIICGIIGIFVARKISNELLGFTVVLTTAAIGYFWLGNKIFKKSK